MFYLTIIFIIGKDLNEEILFPDCRPALKSEVAGIFICGYHNHPPQLTK
jgi:hypothetical protein